MSYDRSYERIRGIPLTGTMTGAASVAAPWPWPVLSLIGARWCRQRAWPSVGRPRIACAYDWPGGPAEAQIRSLSALLPLPGTRGAVAAVVVASVSSDAPLIRPCYVCGPHMCI